MWDMFCWYLTKVGELISRQQPPAVSLSQCNGCHSHILMNFALKEKRKKQKKISSRTRVELRVACRFRRLCRFVGFDLSRLSPRSTFRSHTGISQGSVCLKCTYIYFFVGNVLPLHFLCVRKSASCRATYDFEMTKHSLIAVFSDSSCGCLRKDVTLTFLKPEWKRLDGETPLAPSLPVDRRPRVNFDVDISEKREGKKDEQIDLHQISDLLQTQKKKSPSRTCGDGFKNVSSDIGHLFEETSVS